jgi:hypothetical protein
MSVRFRMRALLPLAAIGIAALVGGCVYPYGYNGYGYGYGYPYGYGYAYAPASVNFAYGGGGWGHPDWHHWDH